MNRKTILIIVVLAAAVLGVVIFMRSRKSSRNTETAGGSVGRTASGLSMNQTNTRTSAPFQPNPVALPGNATQGMSTGQKLKVGAQLAATAGCAAIASPAAAPLCGVAGPLAVDLGLKGAGAIKSGFSKLF